MNHRSALLLIGVLSASAVAKQDVRVVSSDERGIVIEYTPVFEEPRTVGQDGKIFQRWSFEGERARKDNAVGSPWLGVKPLLIGLPGVSGHTVEVLAADYETVNNVLLEPVPRLSGDFDHLRKIYEIDQSVYRRQAFSPSVLAGMSNIRMVRGFVIGDLEISPLQYNPASATVRKYRRILLRVNFGPAAYRAMEPQPDPLMNNLPINYSVAKRWSVEPRTPTQFRQSVFSAGPWYRFALSDNGMYKLSGAAMLAAGIPSSTDPRTIKIFSNGGGEPPDDPTAPYPDDVAQVAVSIHDEGTPNALDNGDYVVFYGQGPRGWKYDPSSKTFSHSVNLYSESAYYWLTYGGVVSRSMDSTASAGGAPQFTPSTVVGKVFREDERVNVENSGRQWLGQSLNPGESATYLFPLPGFDASQPVQYKFSVGAINTVGSSQYTITENDGALVSVTVPHSEEPYGSPYVSMVGVNTSLAGSLIQGSRSLLKFRYTSGTTGVGYIDWMEIFYRRQLTADAGVFAFHSVDSTGIVSYSIGGFTQSAQVFDVSQFDSVVRVVNTTQTGDTCSFRVQSVRGSVHEFYVLEEVGFKAPPALQQFSNQNLHGDTTSVDEVIVTHRDFLAAAQRLKAHRERPGPDRVSTRIVDVDTIYNEFSGGQASPLGIRNYLKYLYNTSSSRPKYALLFGDGDYDYKHISTTEPNWIPVWETLESFSISPLYSYASEDPLVVFSGSSIQMGIGRLPVRSLSEANDVVNKIIDYETQVSGDPWRLRVAYVADDGFEEGTYYASQSETLAQEYTPDLFEKKKIYEAGFPLVVTSAGRRRPSANQAIVDAVNRGALILNFIGHGNPRVWTHEYILVRETDIPRMNNKGKYFFLIAGTCNFSQYDHPFDQSGGEQLVLRPDAGAIGALSASRAVYAFQNFELTRAFYVNMFQPDSLGRIIRKRIGDIYFQTKQQGFTSDNDRKFLLLGDPALMLAMPRLFGSVDTINGAANTSPVRIRSLDPVNVSAQMREPASTRAMAMSGQSLMTVYDADRLVRIDKPDEGFPNFPYSAPGGIIFRGQNEVRQGAISSSFIVPKDISYDTTKPGRISLYFWNDSTDGAGVTRNIVVGGTNPNAAVDTVGPRISLYLNSRSFRPGDLVGDNPVLIADLFDAHGINLSNIGIGHRLEAWLDDQTESVDLSDYYTSKLDSYQEGTIQYGLSGLSPGTHRLRLRAWDTYNNASTAQTIFDVGVSVGLTITNVVNFPNPFSSSTTFTFQHNQILPVDVEVKIYTVAGRLIQTLKERGVTDQFVRVRWNGRDGDGDELANGVYLYKVVARTEDGRFASEVLGKLSKLR